jgi:hypothetical protein
MRTIKNNRMSDNLNKVTKFNKCGGRIVEKFDSRTEPTTIARDSSISLIFEELSEYAKACGRGSKFAELCREYYSKTLVSTSKGLELPADTNIFDEAEVLDAINDMEVTVLGCYNVCGYTDIAEESFNDVMKSNMSKFLTNEDEAKQACESNSDLKYVSIDIKDSNGNVETFYALKRISDDKIMKGQHYIKVNHKEKFFGGIY